MKGLIIMSKQKTRKDELLEQIGKVSDEMWALKVVKYADMEEGRPYSDKELWGENYEKYLELKNKLAELHDEFDLLKGSELDGSKI